MPGGLGNVPVDGAAKANFQRSYAIETLREKGDCLLFVATIGIETEASAAHFSLMHGDNRIQTLLDAGGSGRAVAR
jgi:hypothetical protein